MGPGRWFVVLEEARDVDLPGWQETGGLTPDPEFENNQFTEMCSGSEAGSY